MLVITRKLNEKVRIGNDIVIVVSRISGDSVRIGIDAPRDLRIERVANDYQIVSDSDLPFRGVIQ